MVASGDPHRRFAKSSNRLIGGVCAGIAEYLHLPAWPVRVVFAATTLVTGLFPGILAYGVLWALMPPPWPPASAGPTG